jgi:hypothetical protein
MCAMRMRHVSAIGLLCALGALAPGSGSTTAARPVLPFIADDYTRAVAEARARKVPIFIESWAPW